MLHELCACIVPCSFCIGSTLGNLDLWGIASTSYAQRASPFYMLVDLLHVGRARDATEPLARPLHQHQHRHSPIIPQLMEEVLQIHRH